MVELCGLWIGRRIGVRVGQQRPDRGEYGRYVVDGAPLVVEDLIIHALTVQANSPVGVYVRMEHLRREAHLGRLVRVLLREVERELEGAVLPNGVLGADYNCRPSHDVVLVGAGHYFGVVLALDLLEVAHQSLVGLGHCENIYLVGTPKNSLQDITGLLIRICYTSATLSLSVEIEIKTESSATFGVFVIDLASRLRNDAEEFEGQRTSPSYY